MTTKSDLARTLSAELALLSLEQRISLLAVRFPDRARFSTSFGKEDQALTHAILKYAPKVEIFTLDTGRLFEETYSVFHATRDRLGASIKVFTPDQTLLAQFLSAHGPNSFYESVENRLECCRIRKVEPLQRALENAQIWVTGLRRGQSNNRADLPFVQWDSDYNLLKVHPILDWSEQSLDLYIQEHNIPINRLHSKGFPSIGCAPCTRAIMAGDDSRAGRWWWENPNKKECGLHLHKDERVQS